MRTSNIISSAQTVFPHCKNCEFAQNTYWESLNVEIRNPDSALIEPVIERLADLEVGDTADLEICVTKSAMRNLLRVAQTSESAVSQVSKPACACRNHGNALSC